MNIKITPNKFEGTFTLPSSKAIAHRAIVCACLAKGKSVLRNVNMCDDVKNTINILREIVDIKIDKNTLIINGGIKEVKKKCFYIDESASTIRFLLPILSYLSKDTIEFHLGDRLKNRGFDEYEKLYKNKENCFFKKEDNIIYVKGFPVESFYSVSNKVSSQFASGILLLSPLLNREVTVSIKNQNSVSYIELTKHIMEAFGIKISEVTNNYFVMHNQIYKNLEFDIPSDASFYTNIAVINKLGSNIKIANYDFFEFEPDYEINKKIEDGSIFNKTKIDISSNPDSVFVLSLLLSQTDSPYFITGVDRLKSKESDRKNGLIDIFNSLGGAITQEENTIVVNPSKFKSGTVDSLNDHRVVFFLIALSTLLKSNQSLIIENVDCIRKSFIDALEEFSKVGLKYEVIPSIKEYTISSDNNSSMVLVSRDYFKKYPPFIKSNSKVLIITDKNIPESFVLDIKNRVIERKSECLVYRINKAGESIKTLSEIEKAVNFLLDNSFSKDDVLIALGGGVITDFTAFLASIYKRGIEFVNVPTSLLAMVDASIGGKTGINVGNSKNVIGSFALPIATIIDTSLLGTLPFEELKNGMAEVIKIAALLDPNLLFEIMDGVSIKDFYRWVERAVELKVNVVNKDFYDKDYRHILNFGHTYGHAIELNENLKHGEAIARGMVAVSDNKFLHQALEFYRFDTSEVDTKKYSEAIKNDKKIANKKLEIVTISELGLIKRKRIEL